MVVDEGWRSDLERWLEPFLAGLSHPARRRISVIITTDLTFGEWPSVNAWLLDRYREHARAHRHPELRERTVAEVFEDEKPALLRLPTAPFDGFHALTAMVSKTLLVRFDYNKYSVAARALGRPVEVHAYVGRIVIRQGGDVVAEHDRRFGRDQTVYDQWHICKIWTAEPERFILNPYHQMPGSNT